MDDMIEAFRIFGYGGDAGEEPAVSKRPLFDPRWLHMVPFAEERDLIIRINFMRPLPANYLF